MSARNPAEVIAEALAAKLTEELGWDWKGEQFEDVCMRGGSMNVPSGEQVIRELAESLASAIAALPDIAIVALPKPSVNGVDNACWQTEGLYIEQEFGGEVVISDQIGIEPEELTAVASALLSAAAIHLTNIAATAGGES